MAWQVHNTPIIGSFFDNPDEERKLKTMKQVGQSYERARPHTAQARLNMLANQLGAFGPVNNAMKTMYGPAAGVDMDSFLRNPYTGATVPKPGSGNTDIGSAIGGAVGMAAVQPGSDGHAGSQSGPSFTGSPAGNISGPSSRMPGPGDITSVPQVSPQAQQAIDAGSTDAISRAIAQRRQAQAASRMPGPMGYGPQTSPYPYPPRRKL